MCEFMDVEHFQCDTYLYFFFSSYLSLVQRFIPLSLSMVMLKRHCVANVNVADCLFSDFSISNLIYDVHSMENTLFPSPNVNAEAKKKK